MKKNTIIIFFVIIFTAVIIQVSRFDFFNVYLKNNAQIISFSDSDLSLVPEEYARQKTLIIYNKDQTDDKELIENLEKTMAYLQVDSSKVDFREIDETKLNDYDFIISAFKDYKTYNDLEKLADFIKKGGKLFVAVRPAYDDNQNEQMKLFGIYGVDNENTMIDTQGIKMRQNILIKEADMEIKEDFISNSSLAVKINANANLLAGANDDTPIIWSVDYEEGKVVFFNGTMLDEKINRGIIVGCTSLLMDDFIYPIINAKVNFLDDFPGPVSEEYNQSIRSQMGISSSKFYSDIWWPFMIKEKNLYDLKYSCSILQSYSKIVTPPFEVDTGANKKRLSIFGKEIIKGDDEIGINGYNSMPLALEGYIKEDLEYSPWISIKDMELAIKTVNDFGKSVFENYSFQFYSPTDNILSDDGKNALINAMPDLKVISSIYVKEENTSSYQQEFEVKDGVVEFPRITSGYVNDAETMWNIANGVTSIGVFSHFVHPDDFLNKERSKSLLWQQAEANFHQIQKTTYNNYPWLESLVVSEAANQTIKYLEAEIYLKKEENKIDVFINNYREGIDFILRSEKDLKSYKNCEIMKIDENYYHVVAEAQNFTIELK
ncbi:DUF2194 domain-containing protein [Clostridium sp. DL1XJH146]